MTKWIGTIASLAIWLVPAHVSAQSGPRDAKWHWVWVRPNLQKGGWTMDEGEASVMLKANSFHAALQRSSSDEKPEWVIDGSIQGKSVRAKGVEPGTDAGAWLFKGAIDRVRTKLSDPSNAWGRDIIALHSSDEFVGLYRDVRSSK